MVSWFQVIQSKLRFLSLAVYLYHYQCLALLRTYYLQDSSLRSPYTFCEYESPVSFTNALCILVSQFVHLHNAFSLPPSWSPYCLHLLHAMFRYSYCTTCFHYTSIILVNGPQHIYAHLTPLHCLWDLHILATGLRMRGAVPPLPNMSSWCST